MMEEMLLSRFDMQVGLSRNTGVQVRPPQQCEYSGIDSDEMCVDDDNDGDWYMCVHACVCACEKISNLSLNVACIPSVHYCLLSNHQTTYLGSLKFASCTVAVSALSQPCLGIFLIHFSRGFHAGEKWMVPNLLIRCRNSQHLFEGTVFKRPSHSVPPSSTCMQRLRTVMHRTVNRSLAVVCDRAHSCGLQHPSRFLSPLKLPKLAPIQKC